MFRILEISALWVLITCYQQAAEIVIEGLLLEIKHLGVELEIFWLLHNTKMNRVEP